MSTTNPEATHWIATDAEAGERTVYGVGSTPEAAVEDARRRGLKPEIACRTYPATARIVEALSDLMRDASSSPATPSQTSPRTLVQAARRLRDSVLALGVDVADDWIQYPLLKANLQELRAAADAVTAALDAEPQAPRGQHGGLVERTQDALERILSSTEAGIKLTTVHAHDSGAINTAPPAPTPEPER